MATGVGRVAVTDVTAIPVQVGVTALEDGGIAPYRGRTGAVDAVERVLIRLETADSTVGWGEIRPTLAVETAVQVVENDVAPAVVGREVWEIQGFLGSFDTEYFGLEPFVAGVEMAMWDALGRRLEVPLHRLLGGAVRESVAVAAPLGILPPDTAGEYARRARKAGYDVLKVKAGRDWRADVHRVQTMWKAVDGALEFRVDPNQGWAVEDAVRAIARLEDEGIFLQYVEQPIRIDSVGSLQALRTRVRTPIGVNEDTYAPHSLYRLVAADAIDVAVVDVVPVGGILGLRRQVAAAAAAGVSLSHHDGFDLGIKKAAVLQIVASTPAIGLAVDHVYPTLASHVIATPHPVNDGRVPVPQSPGLGVTVDRNALEAVRLD